MERILKFSVEILKFVGFLRLKGFAKDKYFYMFMIIPLLLYFALYYVLLFMPTIKINTNSFSLFSLHFLLVQFFVVSIPEELFFRGFLMQLISEYTGNRKVCYFLSYANILSSVLFSAAHIFTHSLMWSMSILFPSLIFGYFREKYNSVWPSIILHFWYNIIFSIFISCFYK